MPPRLSPPPPAPPLPPPPLEFFLLSRSEDGLIELMLRSAEEWEFLRELSC